MALARRKPSGELWIVDGNRIRFRQASALAESDPGLLAKSDPLTGGILDVRAPSIIGRNGGQLEGHRCKHGPARLQRG
jgi:hypothetical protein